MLAEGTEAEGRVEEGMMGWKDACAWGFYEACEDRDERKAENVLKEISNKRE